MGERACGRVFAGGEQDSPVLGKKVARDFVKCGASLKSWSDLLEKDIGIETFRHGRLGKLFTIEERFTKGKVEVNWTSVVACRYVDGVDKGLAYIGEVSDGEDGDSKLMKVADVGTVDFDLVDGLARSTVPEF